jgi:hypothetical protein
MLTILRSSRPRLMTSPPHVTTTGAEPWIDRSAEADLVGALLVDPTLWPAFDAAGVSAPFFTDERARSVWIALAALAEGGQAAAISIGAVLTTLREFHLLEVAGGPAFVASLMEGRGRITPSAIAPMVTHLRTLERCRWTFYQSNRMLATIRDYPGQIDAELTRFAEGATTTATSVARPSRLMTDGELARMTDPPYLVPRYLVENTLAVLVSPSGHGKTFVALGFSLSLVTGKKFLGQELPKPSPVIYIPGEGRAGFRRRIAAWKSAHDYPEMTDLGLLLWPGALPLSEPDAVRSFLTEVKPHKPALVVFDTWQRCLGADENDTADVSRAITALDRIRDTLGCAELVLHHTRVDEDRERGSTALRASADTMLALRVEDDLTTLAVTKQKDDEPAGDVAVRLVPVNGSCIVALDDGTRSSPFSKAQVRALDVLKSYGSEGATKGEWLESCAPSMSRPTFYRAVARLKERHDVTLIQGHYRVPPPEADL